MPSDVTNQTLAQEAKNILESISKDCKKSDDSIAVRSSPALARGHALQLRCNFALPCIA
jgi:hypothetical protein